MSGDVIIRQVNRVFERRRAGSKDGIPPEHTGRRFLAIRSWHACPADNILLV
jgi:hypothetical protein